MSARVYCSSEEAAKIATCTKCGRKYTKTKDGKCTDGKDHDSVVRFGGKEYAW